jgi:tRNA-specific 2-thiouridylase
MARVVLAMSGGVDSSVAAHLLCQAGHEVIGLFMRHGEPVATACASDGRPASLPIVSLTPSLSERANKKGCCTASDAADARRIADRLDIPFYALDFQEEFGRIMDYFVEEYVSGRTPNPCVMCNNWLKFGKLCDYADSVGAEFIATGHYAQLVPVAGETVPALVRGVDPGKDQSYVLFGIDRGVLSRVMFPVGEFQKDEIRSMARELGLRVADKKDSQEICFVGDGEYADFVRQRHGSVDLAGEVVTVEGEVVGQHTGLENFTIGQRKGLRLAFGEPRYVVRLETETRRVVIGTRAQLGRSKFTASRLNWLVDPPAGPIRCQVKIRYLSPPVEALVVPTDDGRISITLDEPRDGVAPGQAAVCYQGDRVLGGGWIE